MTRKWSPKVCKGTIVEMCSLEMESPCLLLDSSRVREMLSLVSAGLTELPAKRNEKRKREGAWLALPFYGARGGVPGQNCMDRSHWMKCMISIFQWLNNFRTK